MRRDRAKVIERFRRDLPMAFQEARVVVAYLFGSVARGDATRGSDVDLGVVLYDDGFVDDVLDLSRRVYDSTGIEVDLIVLNRATLRLLREVLRDGVLVYSGNESLRVEFEARMRKLSQDFGIHADQLDRELLAATAEGRR